MLLVGRKGGWRLEGLGARAFAMTARVVGVMMKKRRRMLMSMGQGFGEGSIVEASKGGRFGELTYYMVVQRLTGIAT